MKNCHDFCQICLRGRFLHFFRSLQTTEVCCQIHIDRFWQPLLTHLIFLVDWLNSKCQMRLCHHLGTSSVIVLQCPCCVCLLAYGCLFLFCLTCSVKYRRCPWCAHEKLDLRCPLPMLPMLPECDFNSRCALNLFLQNRKFLGGIFL